MKKTPNEEYFEGRLVLSRQKAGMTRDEVAAKLGIGSKSYAKYEQGKTTPLFWRTVELCYILNVSADYLLLGKKENPEKQLNNLFAECPEEIREHCIHIMYELLNIFTK